MDNRKLTSVRVDSDLFQEFKEQCIRDKFSLQKLVDRAIFLYITDKEFKKKIESQINLKLPK